MLRYLVGASMAFAGLVCCYPAGADWLDCGKQAAVSISPGGGIDNVRIAGAAVGTGRVGGFSVVEVLGPDGRAAAPLAMRGAVKSAGKGRLRLEAADSKARLALRATFATGDALGVTGEVENLDPKRERAVRLDFVLPIRCEGWTYASGIAAAETIKGDGEYPTGPHRAMLFGDRSKPNLIRTSTLWFNAISHTAGGLAIGIDPASPAAFRIGRDARGLFIRYHLGLSALTRKFPNKARFSFIVYGVDGRWGIRSAAERFYTLFPETFRRRAEKFGNWAGTYDITRGDLPNKRDFHITYGDNDFQWRDGEYPDGEKAKLEALGVTVFHWREPWSYFLTGSDAKRSAVEEVRLLGDQASGKATGKTHGQMCGAPLVESARGVLNSYMTDAAGQMLRVRFQYGCRFVAPNMDPELPRPNRASLAADYQFRWVRRWADPAFDGPRNIAWDSCTGWTGIHLLNYRREHFATADFPLTYDPRDGRVCQMKVLADREFAVWHSGQVHRAGGLVMANIGYQALLFFGDCIDVPVREARAHRHVRWQGSDESGKTAGWIEGFGRYRLLIGQKPFSFYQEIKPAGIRRCLLYALAPGGDCKHETYRPMTRKYMPTIRAAAKAGWQPVTHARGHGCHVERFGAKKGNLYFTVMNRDEAGPVDARIVIDAGALGIDPARVEVVELIEARTFTRSAQANRLTLAFRLAGGEALAFALR